MLKIMKHYAVAFAIQPSASPLQLYAPLPATAGIGQSSSVMLDQNTHTITTASNVKSDSNRPPLILPSVPLQMWTLMTYWKI